jgi:putative membrane protein
MKNLFYILLTVILLSGMQSCQDNRKAKNYNSKTLVDEEALNFIKSGLEAGLTEVKAANIALANSQNTRVIGFANMMIADHTKAGDELKKIEGDKNVMANDVISTEHKQMLEHLSAIKGAEFDHAYMSMMVPDHEDAIRLFESVDHNTSGTIQAFAKKTLPTLKMHLDSANAISASLK